MKYRIFVLNLKTDVKRREHIERQLKNMKLDYQIIEAVVGKDLEYGKSPEIDWDFARENANWVSSGALGCSLSHLKAYRAVVEQNLDFGLVLEDDTNLDDLLPEFLEKIGRYLLRNEVLLLYYTSFKKCLLKEDIDLRWQNFKVARPLDAQQLISGNAYLVTKAACSTLLEFQKKVRTTADQWGEYYDNKAIENIRCVFPPTLAEAADFKSSIDYINQQTILGRLLILINRYEIFPFYHFMKTRRNRQRLKMLNFELIA